ncbi:hypothetical protein CC78DRAFT_242778 [Lojkania enalia]|uniref:Uncharacterized protein n=1 Tax=Lojkania enalia TaxID=147567 RepID=A0A9P4NB48_9PLEO|nr:hypothetical protein CC78DRAFT_242778 [Didymosphaeria enalia]
MQFVMFTHLKLTLICLLGHLMTTGILTFGTTKKTSKSLSTIKMLDSVTKKSIITSDHLLAPVSSGLKPQISPPLVPNMKQTHARIPPQSMLSNPSDLSYGGTPLRWKVKSTFSVRPEMVAVSEDEAKHAHGKWCKLKRFIERRFGGDCEVSFNKEPSEASDDIQSPPITNPEVEVPISLPEASKQLDAHTKIIRPRNTEAKSRARKSSKQVVMLINSFAGFLEQIRSATTKGKRQRLEIDQLEKLIIKKARRMVKWHKMEILSTTNQYQAID